VDPLHLVVARFAVGALLVLGAHRAGRIVLRLRNKRLLLVRGLAGGLAIYLNFVLIGRMGLAKSTSLYFLYPVFAGILGVVVLGERFSLGNLVALIVAAVGLLLVVGKDGRIFHAWDGFGWYEGLGIVMALMSGIVVITIRKLHDTDDSWGIYFSQCFVGLVLFIVPAVFRAGRWNPFDIVMMILIGILATIGQLLMTEGFRYLPVRVGSLLGMTDPLFVYLAGVILFREPITLYMLIGSGMILGSCGVVLAGRQEANDLARRSAA
jgi:drug/metabolite transporter (DMT)-like permease